MAANDDFFVKFGSNATTWARELDRQLKPARDQILALEQMLDRLERRGEGVSGRLQRVLGQDLERRSGGGTVPAGSDKVNPKEINYGLEKTSDALADIVTSLGATMLALKNLPQTVKTAARGVAAVGGHPTDLPGQNRVVGPTALTRPGTYGAAGSPGAVNAQVYGILSKLGATAPTQTAIAPRASIAGVGSQAAMEAGLRNVVEAIETQTKQLTKALGGIKVETTPGTAVAADSGDKPAAPRTSKTPSGTKAVAQTEEQMVQTILDGAKSQLEETRQIYATMEAAAKTKLKALAEEHGAESDLYRERKAEIDGWLADQRANVAAAERAASPLTRKDQKALRIEEAQKARDELANLPVISEQEITRRRGELDLIRSTLDPNFLNQVGRKKTEYGIPELREMGRALREQGFDPQFRAKDSMDQMALRLQEAGERFSRAFKDTIPENLRTEGFRTYRETELGPKLQQILAHANDEVVQAFSREREEARSILRQTYQGGDTGDLPRGRRTYGTGLAQSEIGPVPFGQFSPSMVAEASKVFKENTDRQRDAALSLMRQGGFNPYDTELTRSIRPGNTPEERARAADALNVIRDLRSATTEIDRTGQAYVDAGRKIKAMERIIEYINRQLLADAQRGDDEPGLSRTQTKFLEDRLETYNAGLRSQMQIRSGARKQYGDLFDTPEYQSDLAVRRGERNSYERRQLLEGRGFTLSDSQALRDGLGDALRKAIGSDFRYNQSKGRIGSANGLSRDDANELNSAFQHYISVLRQATEAARKGNPGANNLPNRLENATVGLLNQLEKVSKVVPRFEELASLGLDKSGYPIDTSQDFDIRRIQNEANLAGEERRERARLEAQGQLKNIRKADQGPQAAAIVAQEEAARTAKALSDAQEEAKAATKALAAATRARNKAMKNLTDEERADAEAAAAELRELNRKRNALENFLLKNERDANLQADADTRFIQREPSAEGRPDTMGYPAQYGYNPSAEEERARLDREIAQARRRANAAYGGTDPDFENKVKELEQLIAGQRARTQAISDARSEGDLKENAGYHAAREADALAVARIRQLNDELTTLSPVDKHDTLRENAARSKQVVASLQEQVAAAEEKATKAAKKAAKAVDDGATDLSAPLPRDLKRERADLRASGPYKLADIKKLTDEDEIAAANARRARIREISTQLKASDTATAEVVKKAASTTKKAREIISAADKEIESLRAERTSLREQGPYTRADVKRLRTTADEAEAAVSGRRLAAQKGAITRAENRGERVATITAMREALDARQDEARAAREAADAAAQRARRIKEINARLNALDGSSGGSGGGKPPTARGGASPSGPDDNGILAKILAAINAMHNTLKKGGIRVSGAVSGTTEPAGTKAPRTSGGGRSSLTPEQKAARDAGLDRQRELEVANRELNNQNKEEALTRKLAAQSSKAAAADREQEQAKQALGAAMGRLSRSTHTEIEELERLTRAGASSVDIARQQIRVYAALDAELRQQRVGAADRRAAAGAVLNAYGPQTSGNELAGIARAARAQNPGMIVDRTLAQSVPNPDQSEFMQAMSNMFGNRGFWGRIVGSTGAFIVRNFAAGAVFGITNQLQQVLDQALQTETTFVRVSQALEATDKDIGTLRQDLQNISTDYGVALNDVYNSAASLQGLFDDTNQIAAATRISTQLQVISNGALSATEAVGVLASTYTAFQNQPELQGAEGLQKIADTFTLLQNELGVNIETTSEGVSSLAGAAESMGISFQETAVYAGQIAKLTNQSGAAAGEQLGRILASTLTGRGKNALSDAFSGLIDDKTGRDLGAAMEQALDRGDQGAVLRNLMMGWDQLTKTQQDNLAVTIAGQRQMRAFQGLMHDTEGTLNLITKAYHANGEAEDRMQALMRTLNKQIDVLTQNFTNFALALVESGVLNFFGTLLLGVNGVLKIINDLLAGFNQFAEANPFVGFLRDSITWAAGAAISFKLLGASITGLRGALRMNNAEQAALGVLSGAPVRDRQGSVPIGPGLRGSYEHRQSLNDPVSRAGFSQYGRGGPQIGVSRAAAFAVDRVIRVPMERTGRILEKGGLRWEQSNNRALRALAGFSDRLGRVSSGLAVAVEGGVRRSVPTEAGATRLSALQRFAEARQARADSLSGLYGDQRRFDIERRLGPLGDRAGLTNSFIARGLSLQEVADRTGGANPSLQRQARIQQGLASVANGTSTALSKTSATLKGLAASGLAADAALIGVGFAVSALISYNNKIKELRNVVDDAAEPYRKPKEIDEVDATEWMGDASIQLRDASKKFNQDGAGVMDSVGAVLRSFGSLTDIGTLTGGLLTEGDSVKELIARDTIGIDYLRRGKDANFSAQEEEFSKALEAAGSPLADKIDVAGQKFVLSGMDDAANLYAEYMGRIGDAASGQMGYIPDALSKTDADFRKELQDAVAQIEGDASLSDARKTAALAYIEQLDGLITAQIQDKTAVSFGLASGGLNTNQLGALRTALATLDQTKSLGIDSGGILDEQINGIGLEEGSEIQNQINKLRESGTGTAERARRELKILQDAVKSAQANWLTALRSGKEEEFSAADSELNALLSELDRVGNGAVNEIVDEADGLAAAAEAAGQYAKAARIRLQAMKDVDRFNRVKNDPGPAAGVSDASMDAPRGFSSAPDGAENEKGKKRRATKDPALVAGFEATYRQAVYLATKDITLQIARTSDAAARAALQLLNSQIIASINSAVSAGVPIAGQLQADLPNKAAGIIKDIGADTVKGLDAGSKNYGDAVVSQQQVFESQVAQAEAQTSYNDAQKAAAEQAAGSGKDAAAEARANKAALQQARLGVASAAAEARGDSVAAAKIQVAMAKAQLGAARAELAAAKTTSEIAAARVSVLNAQAALIGAQAGVQSAQQDLIQSQYEVSIALAEAAGKTVLAAERQLGAARQALAAARKKSGGKATAEVNAARVSLIQAQAAARDAQLQDQLDTIDFNLEMGKMTQSSAISALQEILRTSDLTKAQRRQLLLQIKGMKDEMADSQWNFGDIKLPTPYQMKRYITERRAQFAAELEAAAQQGGRNRGGPKQRDIQFMPDGSRVGEGSGQNQYVTINIDGADIGKVKKIITDVVGGRGAINTRTTGARRSNR